MTHPDPGQRARAMDGLLRAAEEAAAMPTAGDGTLRRVGDVIAAVADAAFEMRLAYWGYPHPGGVGDQPLVVVVDGRDHVVTRVDFDGRRIRVEAEPLAEP